jgi:hypothetical protein
MNLTCSALLFDLDGVLIDSTPAVARVWHRWALDHGFNPEEVVARAHGRPSLATVRDYLPHADHDAENREVERREIADLAGVVPLPGALALLASLPPDRWTIVTSCTRRLAEVRIQAAGLHLHRQHARQAASRALSERRVTARFPRGPMCSSRRRTRGNPVREVGRRQSHRPQNDSPTRSPARRRCRLDFEQLRRHPCDQLRAQSHPYPRRSRRSPTVTNPEPPLVNGTGRARRSAVPP